MLISLNGEDLLVPMREKTLSTSTSPVSLNWDMLLALVSTIAVCCKGGATLITGKLLL